jgi:hypothetical protein
MKLLRFARSFGAGFGLVLLGFVVAHAANSAFWGTYLPGTTGPWLGDYVYNISTLFTAHRNLAGFGYVSGISASQTSGQANCTQLNNDGLQQVSTSAATGYVCLPTAVSGKLVVISMVPGQTLDIYGSATSYVSGTQDTINGTTGTTAYTSNTGSNKMTFCAAVNNGVWQCLTGS